MTYLLSSRIAYIKRCLVVFITSFLFLSIFNIKTIYGDDVTYVEAPWVYLIENNGVTIIAYVGEDEECQIPWTLGGLDIKYIKKIGNDKVKKIIVPNNDVGIDPSVSEEYEVAFYEVDENGENVIINSKGNSSSISNFFSNLFNSDKKKKETKNDDSSSEIDVTPNDVANKDANNNNNNNSNSNKDITNIDNTPATNKNENIIDPFEVQDNSNSATSTDLIESIKGNYIYIVIGIIVILLVIYLFSRKQSNNVGTSRFIRSCKRRFRRFLNKFK